MTTDYLQCGSEWTHVNGSLTYINQASVHEWKVLLFTTCFQIWSWSIRPQVISYFLSHFSRKLVCIVQIMMNRNKFMDVGLGSKTPCSFPPDETPRKCGSFHYNVLTYSRTYRYMSFNRIIDLWNFWLDS